MKLPKPPKKHSLMPGVSLYLPRNIRGCSVVTAQYERFVDRWCESLTHFWEERTGSFRKYRPVCRDYPRDHLEEDLRADKWSGWAAYSAKGNLEPAAPLFQADFPSSDFPDPYCIEWSDEDAQRILAESLEVARAAEVMHGIAGMTLWPIRAVSDARSHKHFALPFCMRYQGVDLATSVDTGASCHNTIKGVNWLTFVSNAILERVGGEKKLRKQLSERIIFHRIKKGVCFQAGPEPLLGDIKKGEDLSVYHELGKALAPIRERNHRRINGPVEPGNFTIEELHAWLARFDTDEVWRPDVPKAPKQETVWDARFKDPLGPKLLREMELGHLPLDLFADLHELAFHEPPYMPPALAMSLHGVDEQLWARLRQYLHERTSSSDSMRAAWEAAKARARERLNAQS